LAGGAWGAPPPRPKAAFFGYAKTHIGERGVLNQKSILAARLD